MGEMKKTGVQLEIHAAKACIKQLSRLSATQRRRVVEMCKEHFDEASAMTAEAVE